MFIADAHCDYLGRRNRNSQAVTDVSISAMQSGQVRTQVFAAFASSGKLGIENQIRYWQQIELFQTVRNAFESTIPDFRAILGVEGGEAFAGDITLIKKALAQGLKIVTLTWNHENELGYPHTMRGGLKPFGKQAIALLRQHHAAVDVSHLNEDGFWDVLDNSDTLLASHSCARALCEHSRNLTDEQVKAIVARRGFIGINFYPRFLHDDNRADLQTVVDHMLHFLDLGAQDVLGMGSDFDGIETKPKNLETPADFPKLLACMADNGMHASAD